MWKSCWTLSSAISALGSDGNPLGRLSRPALAYSAVISRGDAGSYDMKLNDVARTLPVRRIQ